MTQEELEALVAKAMAEGERAFAEDKNKTNPYSRGRWYELWNAWEIGNGHAFWKKTLGGKR